jgi:hypothetical protein
MTSKELRARRLDVAVEAELDESASARSRDKRRDSDDAEARSTRSSSEPRAYALRLEKETQLHSPILAPVVALVLWSFVMWAWLYATRIPAIVKGKVVLDPTQRKEDFNAQIPARARWKADNYNHLMEQPTLFYAVALTLALSGAGDGLNLGLAWAYVGLRVAHSLVQALGNIILLRFAVFMISSMVLLAMALRAAAHVF